MAKSQYYVSIDPIYFPNADLWFLILIDSSLHVIQKKKNDWNYFSFYADITKQGIG